MSLFKIFPLKHTGELHDVRLITFSVEPEEVLPYLPAIYKPRLINGRALISLVDVKLRNMHPEGFPSAFNFQYRHVAFRLHIDDSAYSGDYKGIYFMRSFTTSPLIAVGGSLLTIYKLHMAQMDETALGLKLEEGGHTIAYELSDTNVIEKQPWLKTVVGNIDRAYSEDNNEAYMVQIMREKWPIEWVKCTHFETDFFKTARLEGAFKVKEMIDYEWLPVHKVHTLTRMATQENETFPQRKAIG